MSSRNRPQLVVVGNGMAGMRAIEELTPRASGRFDITVVRVEPHPNYNRILLAAVLAGEKTLDEIVVNPYERYAEHDICFLAGTRATAIDWATRTVALADGTSLSF